LKGQVDSERYEEIRRQLEYQAGQAVVWRDAVTGWFLRASGIADAKSRASTHPGRLEAERAALETYTITAVTPWEAASGGKGIDCDAPTCAATFTYSGPPGPRDIVVQYFDVNTGAARFRLLVGGRRIGEWTAADRLPTRALDGSSSTRKIFERVPLRDGDAIRIEGFRDAGDGAALDYIEIRPVTSGKISSSSHARVPHRN
jgi:alpha-glucuronidase